VESEHAAQCPSGGVWCCQALWRRACTVWNGLGGGRASQGETRTRCLLRMLDAGNTGLGGDEGGRAGVFQRRAAGPAQRRRRNRLWVQCRK
jgi:hypothetical protein